MTVGEFKQIPEDSNISDEDEIAFDQDTGELVIIKKDS